MLKIIIINGPNLNLLGSREPEKYGDVSLKQIESKTNEEWKKKAELFWFQSNSEKEITEIIHNSAKYDALIINPGAFSHTSVAILDALKTLQITKAEVHITNVYARESFRQCLLTAKGVDMVLSGIGIDVYSQCISAIFNKNIGDRNV